MAETDPFTAQSEVSQPTEPVTQVETNSATPAPASNKLAVSQTNAPSSLLEIEGRIGQLERTGVLDNAQIMELNRLRNQKKVMTAGRDEKPPRPSKNVEERDFKAKQGDLIEYMYDEWILGSFNWFLKKSDKYIRKAGNLFLDRWMNQSMGENEAYTKQKEKEGKPVECDKFANYVSKYATDLNAEYTKRLDAQSEHIITSFEALKELDPNKEEDITKIKEIFGEEKGSELIASLSDLGKEQRDDFIDKHILDETNRRTITKLAMESATLNMLAKVIHEKASNEDFLKGAKEADINVYIKRALDETIKVESGRMFAEVQRSELSFDDFIESKKDQPLLAYQTSMKNIQEGNSWENGKKPENPHLDNDTSYSFDSKIKGQVDYVIEQGGENTNKSISQEELNQKSLEKSVDKFIDCVGINTHDRTLHMANAAGHIVDEERKKHIDKINENREAVNKKIDAFSKLDLTDPEQYKEAEKLMGKDFTKTASGLVDENKILLLETKKKEELEKLDLAEKAVNIAAVGEKGRVLHAIKNNPDLFTKKDENGNNDQQDFERKVSTIYNSGIERTLFTINRGTQKTGGDKKEIENYLNKSQENAEKCLKTSQENLKTSGKKDNPFLRYNSYEFEKKENSSTKTVEPITMNSALSLKNQNEEVNKMKINSENDNESLLDLRLKENVGRAQRIEELRAKLNGNTNGDRINVTEMTRNDSGNMQKFGDSGR